MKKLLMIIALFLSCDIQTMNNRPDDDAVSYSIIDCFQTTFSVIHSLFSNQKLVSEHKKNDNFEIQIAAACRINNKLKTANQSLQNTIITSQQAYQQLAQENQNLYQENENLAQENQNLYQKYQSLCQKYQAKKHELTNNYNNAVNELSQKHNKQNYDLINQNYQLIERIRAEQKRNAQRWQALEAKRLQTHNMGTQTSSALFTDWQSLATKPSTPLEETTPATMADTRPTTPLDKTITNAQSATKSATSLEFIK